jgi:cytoskeletal protein CcmA (bactofilin family)
MSDLRIRAIDESTLQTVLAEDIDFDGELRFSEPLLIKGTVKGTVISDTDLYINPDATVAATITAQKVSVKGQVIGDIHARGRLELFASARVKGNVSTPDLIIQSGSLLNGSCKMYDEQEGTNDSQNA